MNHRQLFAIASWCALLLLAAVGTICSSVRTSRAIKNAPPRRRIVAAKPEQPHLTLVQLECGHRISITHHRIAAIPCEQCKEEGRK